MNTLMTTDAKSQRRDARQWRHLTGGVARSLILTGVLLAASASTYAAEVLGRLFFTPEQRRQLDQQTRQQGRGTVRISGYLLTMPSGKATAWVDGAAQAAEDSADGLSVHANDSDLSNIVVTTPDGRKTRVRVGDQLDTTTGTVTEERIPIQRNAPKPSKQP